MFGEILNNNIENNDTIDNTNRLKSGLINYRFIPVDEMQFEIKTIDISNYNSTTEVVKNMELKDHIYRIILTGTRNIDADKLIEEIQTLSENVCEVINETNAKYNLDEIAKERTIKGVFTKNMLKELQAHPEKEKEIMKAIEYVYNS